MMDMFCYTRNKVFVFFTVGSNKDTPRLLEEIADRYNQELSDRGFKAISVIFTAGGKLKDVSALSMYDNGTWFKADEEINYLDFMLTYTGNERFSVSDKPVHQDCMENGYVDFSGAQASRRVYPASLMLDDDTITVKGSESIGKTRLVEELSQCEFYTIF